MNQGISLGYIALIIVVLIIVAIVVLLVLDAAGYFNWIPP